MNHIKINYKKPEKVISKLKTPISYSASNFGIKGKCTGYRTSFSVISSGLPAHKDIKEFSDTEVFIEKTTMPDDNLGIATMYSGILSSYNMKGIKGIAPKSKPFYAKAINEKKHSSINAIGSSILWSMIKKVDAIILTTLPKKSSYLEQILRKIYMMNICVFVHESNVSKEWKKNPHVIIVNSKQDEKLSIKDHNNNVVVSAPENYTTYLNNKYTITNEKIMSTSIATGLALILIQKNKNDKKRYTPQSIYKQLVTIK